MKKFYFDNSEILMYSISVKNSQNKIIIYKFDDLYQVNKLEYYSIGDKMQFNLKTIDDKMYYSLQIDNKNRFGNILIENNKKINSFSNDVYYLQMKKHEIITNNNTRLAECCRRESSWSNCMGCTVSACTSNWACAITFGLIPGEMAAGFAVSCIGAGPNTFC